MASWPVEISYLDALTRAFEVTPTVASLAVVVDALDEEAEKFYEHYGFVSLEVPGKRRLVLPMKTVEKLLQTSRTTS
jgi:hypothetical protein